MTLADPFAFLPENAVVRDEDIMVRYAHDITGRFFGHPTAVVRPSDVDEVAAVLRTCNEHRIGIVPQGGNTGLVGGGIPLEGQIVLSLERLSNVGAVDPGSRTVVAQAAVTLGQLQQLARETACEFPIDFAARDGATVGGMVATDAGGAVTLRHGTMRDRVAGLQAVFADGTVVDHLDRPSKDSSGFDITRLLPGSEGTLAIITAARLALVEERTHRSVALVALPSLEAAASIASRTAQQIACVEAIDFFLAEGLDLVRSHAGLRAPFAERHVAFLVVSCAGLEDPTDALGEALETYPEVEDVAVAGSSEQRAELWRYRELHNEAINAAGVPHKLDVAVPTLRVPELVSRVDHWLRSEKPGTKGVYYGHLADGNVHVNILGAQREDESIDAGVLEIVADMGGSISAEHGIGQAKRRWLHLTRSPEEIDAMRAIKKALDPNGIMNPGKLLP